MGVKVGDKQDAEIEGVKRGWLAKGTAVTRGWLAFGYGNKHEGMVSWSLRCHALICAQAPYPHPPTQTRRRSFQRLSSGNLQV